MKYSPSTGLFYSPALHKSVPKDCIDIPEPEYQRLLDGKSEGMLIEPDKTGTPQLVSAPPIDFDYMSLIASRRFTHETAGIVWNGYGVATDRDSRALIDQELAAIDRGERQDGEHWKCLDIKSGAVTWWAAPNADFYAMSLAVRSHVKECFAREKALMDLLAAGEFHPAMLDEGWPA